VGAPGDDTAGPDAGAAYLIELGTGTVVQTFLDPEPQENRSFAQSVLAVGSSVIIGAPCRPTGGSFVSDIAFRCTPAPCAGAVYVFDAATGMVLRTYTSPRVAEADWFGIALASRGADLLIGMPASLGLEADAVFLVGQEGRLLHTFEGPTPSYSGGFGVPIAAVGPDVWVGSQEDHGSVFVFASTCGNGRLDVCESCDDGNTAAGDGCSFDCRLESCGDGRRDTGEHCDDGNVVDGDGCDANCTVTGCRNCIATGAEQCDDGNRVDGDGCDANCTVSMCGNGVAGRNEECDDGNATLGDGCDTFCRTEACGNRLLDAGESCVAGRVAPASLCRRDGRAFA
jgi:cysteine-rich repeat protein